MCNLKCEMRNSGEYGHSKGHSDNDPPKTVQSTICSRSYSSYPYESYGPLCCVLCVLCYSGVAVVLNTKVYRQVRLAHFMGDEQKQTRIHIHMQKYTSTTTTTMMTTSTTMAMVMAKATHLLYHCMAHVRSHSIIENAAPLCNYIFVLSLVTLCFQLCTSPLHAIAEHYLHYLSIFLSLLMFL